MADIMPEAFSTSQPENWVQKNKIKWFIEN